jgi:signal peptidase complex subunit 2
VRLALGYGSFAVAAACFLWDYKLGWDTTKTWTQVAVIIYAGLSYTLSNWTQNVEKGAIYRATAPSGEEVCASPVNLAAGRVGDLSSRRAVHEERAG